MSGYFKAPRELWPAVADGLPRPWLDEWVELDCAYWAGEAEREVKGYRSALPRRRPPARWFSIRWGWTVYRTRQALRQHDPLSTNSTRNRTNVDTESNSSERVKLRNGRKFDTQSNKTQHELDTESTTRAYLADFIPQTTDHIPPKPPKGDTEPAMVSAVRSAMALDPMHMGDSAWLDCHPLADVWAMARDQGTAAADELRATMLAQRPTEPMSPEQVLAVMRSQGWRGSGRLRDIARTCHELSQACDQRQGAD